MSKITWRLATPEESAEFAKTHPPLPTPREILVDAAEHGALSEIQCDICGNLICMARECDLNGTYFFCEACYPLESLMTTPMSKLHRPCYTYDERILCKKCGRTWADLKEYWNDKRDCRERS